MARYGINDDMITTSRMETSLKTGLINNSQLRKSMQGPVHQGQNMARILVEHIPV